MIEKLIEFSIKKKFLILTLGFLISILGVYASSKLSVDAVPDVTNVQVSAVTVSPGLSPLLVEQLITTEKSFLEIKKMYL